jgi:hypothetical protein
MSQTNATLHLSNRADADVTIRLATGEDAVSLARLAALDSRPQLAGACLVAEVGGVLWAARSLETGDVVADPFRPTLDHVALLHERARHLLQGPEARRTLGLGALLATFRPRRHGVRSS